MLEISYLRERLLHCPATGRMWWKDHADIPNNRKSQLVGREAFTAMQSQGYRHGSLKGYWLRAHRAIWALHYGVWPDGEIDHINHIRDDNRIENLRVVSHTENNRNTRKKASNTSGVTGVYWTDREQRWIAEIKVDGVKKCLGYFTRFEDAARRRLLGEFWYGFHHNHGRNI